MILKHIGSFRLPAGRQAHDLSLPEPLRQFARFGFGGRALCLSGDRKGFWLSGHDVGDLVGGVIIPDEFDGRTANEVLDFFEVMPRQQVADAGLDALVGLAVHEGKLWALFNEYYDLDGTDGDRVSLWDGGQFLKIADGHIKKTSGYLTAHDGALWCGRSDGAGNPEVHHGPALYRIDSLGSRYWWNHDRPDWSEADKTTALAFLPGYVCFLVSKAVGPVWYGQPDMPDKLPAWFDPAEHGFPEEHWRKAWKASGIVDRWQQSKGNHTTAREVWLMPYTFPGLEEQPPIVLTEFHESADCGGMAFDAEKGILYVHEAYPPDEATERGVYPKESPRIHVYNLEVDGAGEPEPERPGEIVVTFPEDERPVTYENTPKGRLELIHDVSEELVFKEARG